MQSNVMVMKLEADRWPAPHITPTCIAGLGKAIFFFSKSGDLSLSSKCGTLPYHGCRIGRIIGDIVIHAVWLVLQIIYKHWKTDKCFLSHMITNID